MQPILLCLHGWGGSKESFTELRSELRNEDLQLLTPDLPGFGEEPEPTKAWTIEDYALWVEKYCALKISYPRPIGVLGHSHGGSIAIKLAARGRLPISHLYLCASARIKRRESLKRTAGKMIAKTGNAALSMFGSETLKAGAKKLLYKGLGVHDYERASPIMKQTMKLVLEEDVSPVLPGIKVPADIFWGEDDTMTPEEDAQILHEALKGSQLHLFPGVKHNVHRAKADEIAKIIRKRIAEEG